jgi:hypothetical protein
MCARSHVDLRISDRFQVDAEPEPHSARPMRMLDANDCVQTRGSPGSDDLRAISNSTAELILDIVVKTGLELLFSYSFLSVLNIGPSRNC